MSAKVYGDRWEVIEAIDEGGQAHIFKVRDRQGEHAGPQVLKRLKNLNRIDRFEREIQVGMSLTHPGIAPVLDFSLSDTPYFVTPHYPGPVLTKIAPLSPRNALQMFCRLCDTVTHAHDAGVFHRDLKPDNVILDESKRPIVLDFGLCYQQEDDRLTATMEQVGSRFYMAPELEGGRTDHVTDRVDSYAVGKILYFLLTGKHIAREAYDGDNDLCRLTNNAQLGYVTQKILKKSVTADSADRLKVSVLRQEADKVMRLLWEHRYPGKVGSLCRFCGEGVYDTMPETKIEVRQPHRQHLLRFAPLICHTCGNIQWFMSEEE